MLDGVELEQISAKQRRMGSEARESFVLPPDVFGALAVMRDPQPAPSLVALEPPVAEQRSEDDLDLHGIRHDAPEHALRMLPHAENIDPCLKRAS